MKKTLPTIAFSLFLPAAALAQQPPAGPPLSMADAFMHSLDANHDGKVDKAEFLKPYEAQFQRMDSNGDGVIDRAEVEALEKRVRERMEQMRRQRGGQR